MASAVLQIRPQQGPQETFLSSSADIVIYGGAAGGGKTFGLLLETTRHLDNPEYGAVIFRRTYPEIAMKGGLWDESRKIYPAIGGMPKETTLEWEFPSRASIKFAHLQYESDLISWGGSQIPLIAFDQIDTFTERMFWFLFSRNRSMCGVRPYIRATCNPVVEDDAEFGWLATLIGWWIDPETGYPIPERSGVPRWFVRINDALQWDESAEALRARFSYLPADDVMPKSLTFIPAKLSDNLILMRKDPGYRANLLAMPLVERERLLGGNWKVRPSAGKIFNRAWFDVVGAAPTRCIRLRYWDKAGTHDGGCFSAGVRMAYDVDEGGFYIEHCLAGQWSAHAREQVIRQTAALDGPDVEIWIEQEPGSGGKESAENTILSLPGFIVRADRVTGDKIRRSYPMSAQAEARNVKLVRGDWVAAWLDEAHKFEEKSAYKDRVDAAVGAYNQLAPRAARRFDIAGGGAERPSDPVLVGTNGGTQLVDPSVLASIHAHGFRR